MNELEMWHRYQRLLCTCDDLGIAIDVSRMHVDDADFAAMREPMQQAFHAMDNLERGAIANPDERRMVGHYWLRNAELAPSDDLRQAIITTVQQIDAFAKAVHDRTIKPPHAAKFTDLLVIGIGGSALGPQLVADALGEKRDKLNVHFMDNTDPDGMQRMLQTLGARLKSTLVLVISKSGGTPETRNGMIETQAAFAAKKLDFARQAVAITGSNSRLDQTAMNENWLQRFPMWDWVGGRTSVMSAVGLLPAALQGIDIHALLNGAAKMDELTRLHDIHKNPAALLAMMWHKATDGKGARDMVILPYKDRLLLFSRYLQQLVMESLGKELDLQGNVVNQGIAVYGNKGSTDQHAYVQQLREGLNNFFVTFIIVMRDTAKLGQRHQAEVEPGTTSGDYLHGFWQGTRQALFEKGRQSITIIAQQFDAATLGALIALYERAVGLYAALVNINAYHQPGVEAGKKAAAAVLALQRKLVDKLAEQPRRAWTLEDLVAAVDEIPRIEAAYHLLEHLAANRRLVKKQGGKYRGG